MIFLFFFFLVFVVGVVTLGRLCDSEKKVDGFETVLIDRILLQCSYYYYSSLLELSSSSSYLEDCFYYLSLYLQQIGYRLGFLCFS